MVFLVDFAPLKPDPGLFIWTVLIFLLFWLLVGKYAFKPITNALKKRDEDIQEALDEALRAKEEMAKIRVGNEELLKETREERGKILAEAKEMKQNIISEAQASAKKEAANILTEAKSEIENQKNQALREVKNEAGKIALDIAKNVLQRELDSQKDHESLVSSLIDKIDLN